MRPINYSLVTMVLAVMLCGSYAQAQKIRYDVAAGTDFSKYKTYKWQRDKEARYPSEENDAMLMRAIDTQLASKGLVKTDSDSADVYVIYSLAILDNMEWGSFRTEIGGWTYSGNSAVGMPGFYGATTNTSEAIKSGALIIDIFDVAQKKRVWQAFATKTVDPGAPLNKREKNSQKVMAKILKPYPGAAR